MHRDIANNSDLSQGEVARRLCAYLINHCAIIVQGCRGYGDSHGYGCGMGMGTMMNPHGSVGIPS